MRLRQHVLIVVLFYLAIALVITFPLITTFSTRLIGHPTGDAYEYIHHVWWIKTALQTGQNPFFMPNIVYPDGVSAVLLWSIPLQSFPAWLFAFVLPLPAAFNLAALLTLAFNGWSMFFLVRYLLTLPRNSFAVLTPPQSIPTTATASPTERGWLPKEAGGEVIPALIAGLVFMIYPAFQGQLGAAHVGLLTLYPAPLFLYALLRLADTQHPRRWLIGGALLFVISLWGSVLLLIYLIAPITLLYFALLLLARDWRTLRRALLTVVLGAILSLPFVVPLALDTLQAPLEAGSVRYSASLLGVVSPSFYHPLFANLGYNRQVLGLDPFEWTSYVGVIAAALALIAVWKRRAARAWLILALVAWVFSLGPLLKLVDTPLALRVDGYASFVTLPWALFQNLPLISIARTPARFNFAVGFAVAVLVGYGSAVIWSRLRGARLRWIAALLLLGLIVFEYQVWWGLPTVSGVVPESIAALSERDDLRAVLDLPVNSLANKDAMFLQTGHHHPLITGQVARSSPVNPAEVALLQATLDPKLLYDAQADVVIVHKAYDDGTLETYARNRLGDPFYEDDAYVAFFVPLVQYLSTFAAVPSAAPVITTQINSFVYSPTPGWVDLTAKLNGSGRQVVALLDGTPVQRWTLEGKTLINLPLPVTPRAFQTITLALDPPCPEHFDSALICASVHVADLALDYTLALPRDPVQFDKGVTLLDAHLPRSAPPGDTLSIWLDWGFDQPLSGDDIRFVHLSGIAGTSGALVAQQDSSLGAIPAGDERAESVTIALPDDLPPGDYTVSAGWYSYPDIANFCVLTDGACSADAATLGTIHVEE